MAHAVGAAAWADRLAQEGLSAQLADDLVLAEARYRECLALNPHHDDAMHMLGVVRMASFDFAEAKTLIERAGQRTQWQYAPYRHNYGYVLSAYLPARNARPTAAQHAALHRVRARYAPGPSDPLPVCAVLQYSVSMPRALVADNGHDTATHIALRQLHVGGTANASTCEQIHKLLLASNADYVAFASADAPLDAKRLSAMIKTLEAAQAGWAFSTVSFDNEATPVRAQWPKPLLETWAGLNNAQFTEQLAAMCVATPLLPLSINNLVVRASLLADISWQTPQLSLALGELVSALCQKDEPCLTAHAPLLLTAAGARAIADDFAAVTTVADAAQGRYIDDAFSDAGFVNPLAPSLATHGLAFLKRPLRYGAGAKLTSATLANIAQRIAAQPTLSHPMRGDGFDLIGFARAESGLGENVRALAQACAAVGLAHSVIDIDIDSGIRKSDNSLDSRIVTAPVFCHQIICVNPDALNEAVHHEGAAAISSACKIGYWFWELEKIPTAWVRAAAGLQELWAASEFVRCALAKSVSIPVFTVPTPIRPPQPSRAYMRSEFGLENGDFVFLFSFAYGSMITRKNPWALVRAFREAFPVNVSQFARARLVIKSVQSELYPEERASLHALAAGDPRIRFIDRFMTRDEVMGLQVSADCYASLHRSEGFGLGMAECMAIGKPVIGTAYSANLDFMNESNSLLVDYSLVAVKPGEYPDTQDQLWADARVDSAARHMRAVFERDSLRHDIGRAAQQFMREHYSPAAIGALLRGHLQRLNETSNFAPLPVKPRAFR